MAADITEGISGKPRDNMGQRVRWWPQHTVSLTTDKFFQISQRRNILRRSLKNAEINLMCGCENLFFETVRRTYEKNHESFCLKF